MTEGRLGVGIIGLGGIGLIHAQALHELADRVELVAYSGVEGASAAGAGWPGTPMLAPEEVLSHPRVSVVAICSPSQTHAALARDALKAGRHIVVEKPLALTVGDALEVARLARQQGLVVSMVSQRRFESEYRYLKHALDSGALGHVRLAITHVHWYRDEAYYRSAPWRTSMAGGGGSLMNQGVHNVDLLRWLCGPVESVTAHYGTLGHAMEAEDTTVATLRFESGALGVVSTSTATPPGDPATLTLHTSRGVVQLGQGEVLRWDVDGVPPPPADPARIASGAADPLAIGHAGHLNQWRDVLRALDDGVEPLNGPDDAVETVRLLAAIYAAAGTGAQARPAELGAAVH
ncbi:Gfo/Idh/MocA family protein [Motilibacter aurantiacus]|uniref:Gfo/Idh/MocA family protein n=1 Tax=Motilibacter aurantiacus TaxID=2714955 RepID=UPI001408CB86|nr:Gfo/Idh/MocA family oxidoreductase [Motilibacter aurantiacus]